MFRTIFTYELKYWLKQPSIYGYAILIFAIAFVTMSGMASEPPDRFNERMVNAPIFLYMLTSRFFLLLVLLIPAVVGWSANREFGSNMHTLLFAYPFVKRDYLAAKFLSGLAVFMVIALMLGFGYWLGTQMSWVNPQLLLPTNIFDYLRLYGVVLLPNILFVSVLVFGTVLLIRNVFMGFIISLLLILVPQLVNIYFDGDQPNYWAALLDPFGTKAINYYTHDWTVAKQNSLSLPLTGWIIWNRLLWLGVTSAISFWIYCRFQFQQTTSIFSFQKRKGTQNNAPLFRKITQVVLPKVNYQFSWKQQISTLWHLSMTDCRFVLKSKGFLILVLGGLVFVLFAMATVKPRFGTETLPMTWQILEQGSTFYAGVTNLITFLYAGILIQRAKMNRVSQLVDVTPTPNWVFLGAKVLALVKIQVILLAIVMVGGMLTQISKGFYDFDIGQYLFHLFVVNLIHFVIWAMLAVFVQTLVNHPYVGFFLLLLLPVGFIGLAEFGPQFLGMDFFEQYQFRYNQAPGDVFGLRYSDMDDSYGPMLWPYFVYKFYWLLAGLILVGLALLLQVRGLPHSFKERLQIIRQRWNSRMAVGLVTILIAFGSLAAFLYYENNIKHPFISRIERRTMIDQAEAKYKRYEFFNQPKIVAVNVDMNIFPKKRQFKASGYYTLINKSDQPIDTLVINYLSNLNNTYSFDKTTEIVSQEAIADVGHFDVLTLETPLLPGDSMRMNFSNESNPITALHTNDWVKSNGTLIKDDVFPRLGNWLAFFKSESHHGHNHDRPHPADSTSMVHSYMARDADQVDFEATVSTSSDQVALAPGELKKEWKQDGRRYFYYKMNEKISPSYLFMSGDYAVKKDQWQGIHLAIYYDPKHPYNIDRMMAGLKAGLAYCTKHYSPYQFKQTSIVEFSQTGGASAHGYPSIIPTGEGAGFIADVDDSNAESIDYPFGLAVHEVAHQWWGHQVMPANVLGAKMVVESMADYTRARVTKKEEGVKKYRELIKQTTAKYIELRNRERHLESPLHLTYPNQNYIHYAKGTVVLCALNEYLGEAVLNGAIREYVQKVAFQEKQYTTSLELVDYIRKATPDSLQYLIKDLLETVTLYDNRLVDWQSTPLANGQYQVDISFLVSKYRSGRQGVQIFEEEGQLPLQYQSAEMDTPLKSLSLADYLEIGVFGKNEAELYLQKHKITQIDNQLRIIVDALPIAVGIDPYGKMIDKDGLDNLLRKETE
ncbi:MAG: M1 family aminopeptidase [Bacteroidota bacterium]